MSRITEWMKCTVGMVGNAAEVSALLWQRRMGHSSQERISHLDGDSSMSHKISWSVSKDKSIPESSDIEETDETPTSRQTMKSLVYRPYNFKALNTTAIPKHNGDLERYRAWYFQIRITLRAAGVWSIVTGQVVTPEVPVTDEEFINDQAEKITMSYLMSTLKGETLRLVIAQVQISAAERECTKSDQETWAEFLERFVISYDIARTYYSSTKYKRKRWDADKAKRGELDRVLEGIVKMVGEPMGHKLSGDKKVIVTIRMGDFSSAKSRHVMFTRRAIEDYVTALIDTGSEQLFFNDAALFQSIVHRDARFNTIIGHDDELVAGTGPVSRVLAERLVVHIKSAYYVPSASTNILAYADVAMEYPAQLQYDGWMYTYLTRGEVIDINTGRRMAIRWQHCTFNEGVFPELKANLQQGESAHSDEYNEETANVLVTSMLKQRYSIMRNSAEIAEKYAPKAPQQDDDDYISHELLDHQTTPTTPVVEELANTVMGRPEEQDIGGMLL
ncbi:hypothetical protein SeLEV6574_g07121 [Synchytrium endobioticum]|uniref:Uncharacterized protein n=1 Tax=Synchytrium endobioticum TaxID=286115 RepID=A0A507CDH1_9FUNG|nr:hypothetical protein SeLEV6574_g07121 [Synchytrium endobioticum]